MRREVRYGRLDGTRSRRSRGRALMLRRERKLKAWSRAVAA